MQKVDGIQGVRVSLKDGLTILDLKPGNGARSFVVSGTNEQLTVSDPPRQVEHDWRMTVPSPKP